MGTESEGMGPPLPLHVLSELQRVMGGPIMGRRVLRVLGVPAASRLWLRRSVLESEVGKADEITVLIGVRNRLDYRLENSLRSLRDQTISPDRVTLLVVDYGSDTEYAGGLRAVCEHFDARYLRLDGPEVWSRGRCLNAGLRRTDSKFVLFSDTDLLFSRGYLEGAIDLLRSSPLSLVGAPMRDLPEDSATVCQAAAAEERSLDLEALRVGTPIRRGWTPHPSILAMHTIIPRMIRGYDEFFETWGAEDEDFARRLRRLGLRLRSMGDEVFYLHQWHRKFEGVPGEEAARAAERNRMYLEEAHSILRNGPRWGLGVDHGTQNQVPGTQNQRSAEIDLHPSSS